MICNETLRADPVSNWNRYDSSDISWFLLFACERACKAKKKKKHLQVKEKKLLWCVVSAEF